MGAESIFTPNEKINQCRRSANGWFLMVVVDFILGLLQRLLLTLDLFFFGLLPMFSLLFNRMFFVVRERTRRCGSTGLLFGYGGRACHRSSHHCRMLHDDSRCYQAFP